MSYFTNPIDPEDFEDGHVEDQQPKRSKSRLFIGVALLMAGIVGTTFAANISLGGARKEFGQGVYQIKACDSWVGFEPTTGQGAENTYIKKIRLMGLDPRLCKGNVFRIKFIPTGSNLAMDMYKGAGTTTSLSDSVTATTLVLRVTSTAYTGSTQSAYNSWAFNAVTLIDPMGRDIGRSDTYEAIAYTTSNAVYTVTFTYPLAIAANLGNITIESAKYQ